MNESPHRGDITLNKLPVHSPRANLYGGGGIKSILRTTLLLYKKLYHNFPPSLLQRDLQLFIRVTCTKKEEIT